MIAKVDGSLMAKTNEGALETPAMKDDLSSVIKFS